MSRFSQMSPRARRGWTVALVLYFVLMFAGVGISYWWAETKNVPHPAAPAAGTKP